MNLEDIRKRLLINAAKFASKVLGFEIPSVPSATAIIQRGKKILVIDLTYINGYALPGGAPKKGETLEEALKREVEEETGLVITSAEYFGSYTTATSIGVVYKAKVKGKIRDSKEGKTMWVRPEEVIDNMSYVDNKKALNDLIKRSGETD